MSPFTWTVPYRRITLTSMLYIVNQPAPERSVVVLCLATPFFDLRHIYRILTVPFSIYMLFKGPWQSLFRFTCYLPGFDGLLFLIYIISTGTWQSPFSNLQHIYSILRVSFFRFTCYLQDVNCVLFLYFTCYLRDLPKFRLQNLQHPVSHLQVQIEKCTWYLFTWSLKTCKSPKTM